MFRFFFCLVMSLFASVSFASGLSQEDGSRPRPVITELPTPAYPPMALAAHVSGDVSLAIKLGHEGGVETVEVVSGPPMLRQTAVALANQTKFECRGCEGSTTMHMTYRFVLGDAIYCEGPDRSYPRIAFSEGTVTITDRPFGTCDVGSSTKIRARSARCLFLWKCGWKTSD
jgi:TonB family protein